MLAAERGKHDVLQPHAGISHYLEFAPQGMSVVDLVVPKCADKEQMLRIGPDQKVLDQIECRRVQPLQIIEKKRQWVLGSCKDADETTEHALEPVLRLHRRKVENWWLVADDQSQLRDE